MGRRRTTDKHLPPRMRRKGARYYHVSAVEGKQRWLPLGNDYGEALRQWSELEGAKINGCLTVAEALAHYLDDRSFRLSDKTMTGYRAQARTLGKVFGTMRLGDVTRAHVYTYLRKRGNVAGNRERDLLRAAYNHAANLGYTGGNPCANMQVRNTESPRKRYLTDAEFAALVAAAKPRLAVLLQFLYLTGMRIGDAIRLPLTAADDDGVHWQEGKTGRPRFVEWSAELRALWKAAAGSRIGAQAAFVGQRGPYTLDGLESTWTRVRVRAGVPDATLHDIRRKAASDLPLERARELLGHTNSAVTQRHYRAKADPVKPVR